MSSKKKRKAAFLAGRPVKGRKSDHAPGPILRWEKRPWTPFVDVTNKYPSVPPDVRVLSNSLYTVVKRTVTARTPEGTARSYQLEVVANDYGARHDWRHLQRIKNEVCGPEFEAAELLPAESRLVDTANVYYLWVLPEGRRFNFGFLKRSVSEHPIPPGSEQRLFEPGFKPPELYNVPAAAGGGPNDAESREEEDAVAQSGGGHVDDPRAPDDAGRVGADGPGGQQGE